MVLYITKTLKGTIDSLQSSGHVSNQMLAQLVQKLVIKIRSMV